MSSTPNPLSDAENPGGAAASAPPPAKKKAAPFKLKPVVPWYYFLNPFAWILWILDFVLWLLLPFPLLGPCKMIMFLIGQSGSRSVKVDDTLYTRRRKGHVDKLTTEPYEGCGTGYAIMKRSFNKFASQKCMGTRKFLGWHKTEGMRFPIKKFGATSWMSYAEVGERVESFGRGLRALGMESCPPGMTTDTYQASTGAHTMLIFEETCAQWTTALMGAHSQSLVVATSYSTLGISAVIEAVNETGCAVILCNLSNLEKIKAAAGDAPSLKAIVYSTNYVTDADIPEDKPVKDGAGPMVLSVEAVIAMGKENTEVTAATPPEPAMPAVVMYTSGSTGKPKGVMIPHKSIAASVSGILGILTNTAGMDEGKQTYLAYLPAAHILELCAELAHFGYGSAVGYADPKAIASTGAIREKPDGTLCDDPFDPLYPPGGIGEFKPTMFAAVPKIWDIMKKGLEAKVGGMSPVLQFILQLAFATRVSALAWGRNTPLFNVFFGKFYKAIGGKMILAVTGGGPCSSEVQTFIRTALMTPLIQGYALTETTCAGCIQMPSDPRDGIVGAPLSCIEMRLKSHPDVNDRSSKPYLATDTSHYGAACLGRGEVLIRGDAVSAGYYKMPEKTAEEFDSDGWFHTGDVGVWTPDGSLKIVDRIKNLVKLSGGEYIAVEAMESAFNTSVYVDGQAGGVLVYGSGEMDRAVAIVQANNKQLKDWAASNGIAGDIDEICASAAACKFVCDDLNAEGKKANLGLNEKLAAVHLISGTGNPDQQELNSPWTPENNFLTASNKLNRKVVEKGLAAVLDPLKAKGIK